MCSSMGIFPVFRYVNMRYEYAKIHLRCVSFRSMQQFLTLSRRMSMFSLLFPLTGRRSQEEKMEKYTNRSLLRGFVYFSYFARARWTALRASSNSDFCVCDTRKGIYAINTTVTALGSTIKIVIFFFFNIFFFLFTINTYNVGWSECAHGEPQFTQNTHTNQNISAVLWIDNFFYCSSVCLQFSCAFVSVQLLQNIMIVFNVFFIFYIFWLLIFNTIAKWMMRCTHPAPPHAQMLMIEIWTLLFNTAKYANEWPTTEFAMNNIKCLLRQPEKFCLTSYYCSVVDAAKEQVTDRMTTVEHTSLDEPPKILPTITIDATNMQKFLENISERFF